MDLWENNVLEINDPNNPKLFFITKFINEELSNIEGDYVEFGVYKAKSLLTIAREVSKIKSSIICYGFDSFNGFPNNSLNHPNDEQINFEILYKKALINKNHYDKVKILKKHIAFKKSLSPENLTNLDLSNSSNFQVEKDIIETIYKKADYLKIRKNIKIHKCNFLDVKSYVKKLPDKISFCLLDADLYPSYKATLPLIWERLSSGGLIFLDEYYSLKFPGAKIATDEFVKEVKCNLFQLGITGDFERWAIRKD